MHQLAAEFHSDWKPSHSRDRDQRLLRALLLLVACLITTGCGLSQRRLDVEALSQLRGSLANMEDEATTYYEHEEPLIEEPQAKPGVGSVIVGEMLAIFPGFFIHGLGHYYAGDRRTSRQINRVGQFGYVMTALGGGVLIGGYALDQDDTEVLGSNLTTPTAYTLYAVGGVGAAIGVTYFFTAWIYDIIDTPRAVRSGGKPPPRSKFVESLDFFDN